MPLNGHKNVQSITNYSSLNLNQQNKISGILSRASSQTLVTAATNETAAASTCTSKILICFSDGAVISGGQFTFSMHLLPRRPFKPGVPSPKPPKKGERESEFRSPTRIKV